MIKRGDYVIIAIILATAAALTAFLSRYTASSQLYAEIWKNHVLIERIKLEETTNREIDLDGHNTIVLQGKTARIAAADCSDQVCVRTGTLSKAGQAAICLPNEVIVKLVGGNGEVDAIAS